MGEWRGDEEDGYIVCDPTLDSAIACLPAEVRHAIWAGRNVSYEQAEAVRRREEKKARDNLCMGTRNAPPEPEQ